MPNEKMTQTLRILVTGWPGSGKSHHARELAEKHGLKHLCTDPQSMCEDNVVGTPNGLDWSECSQYVADNWLHLDNVVIEGVALPRALRKWRKAHPDQPPPCDRIILMSPVHTELSKGQTTMGKGMDKVFKEIQEWLEPVLETK